MKEIWRFIKGTNKKYQVSNYGRIKSKKRKHVKRDRILTPRLVNNRLYIYIKGFCTNKSVAKLVLFHFRKKEIGKEFALHLNMNTLDNKSTNLEWATFGDVRRMSFEARKKKRGVYKFNTPLSKKKWRAVIKINNKAETIGYFKLKKEAQAAYFTAYTETYGRAPY